MAENYGPAEIAAARAKIAKRRQEIAYVPDDEPAVFGWEILLELADGWGAALDALEAAPKFSDEMAREWTEALRRIGWRTSQKNQWMDRAREAEARAEVAETEVIRLTADHERQRDYLAALQTREAELEAENASLLRRVESLRMAVWGESHGEKAP